MMAQQEMLTRSQFKTPRAAAVAGILFSILFITSMVLIRISVPTDLQEAGDWLSRDWKTVAFALNLLPFAGVFFLWFIGVLRDRIGAREDRLFATVFLGSGILFLGMLFVCAAVGGGLILSYGISQGKLLESGIYTFGRTVTQQIMRVYAMRMAGVFMMLTSKLALQTGILPRWMAILGYLLAIVLLFGLGRLQWISLVFPLWVLLISIHICFSKIES